MWCLAAGVSAASDACLGLLAGTGGSPAIPLALRSLLTSTADHSSPPVQQQGTSTPQQTAAVSSNSPQDLSPEQQKQALIIQMTMHATLRPLTTHTPDSDASSSGRSTSAASASAAAPHFACHVITAPQLLSQLPAAARKQLTSASTLIVIMTALQRPTSSQGNRSDPTSKTLPQKGKAVGPDRQDTGDCLQEGIQNVTQLRDIKLDTALDAVLALGNLAGLLSGDRVTKATQVCLHT